MKKRLFVCAACVAVLVACMAGGTTLEDLPFETVVETAGEATPKLVSHAKAAAMFQSDSAYPVATNALALASTALQPGATNGMLTAEADTLATVTARGATTTNDISIGSVFIDGKIIGGDDSQATGLKSIAFGSECYAFGPYSFAFGQLAQSFTNASIAIGMEVASYARAGIAIGAQANVKAGDDCAFAWSGEEFVEHISNGPGTFNINPVGGLAGFWIGETTLASLLNAKATYLAATNITAAAVAGSGHAMAEQVVSGAVCTAASGYRYFWTSATNVVLSVNLTSGQVVNLARLNNTATNSITAIGQVGWEWTGGDMTNTIAAGKSMTFGFLVDAATGKTNAYATGVSK